MTLIRVRSIQNSRLETKNTNLLPDTTECFLIDDVCCHKIFAYFCISSLAGLHVFLTFSHRAQKQRATRSEDALESLNVQIMERDNFITELRADLENTRSNVEKLNKEKIQCCTENSTLNTYVFTI